MIERSKNREVARQGDVFIRKVSSLPKGLKKAEKHVDSARNRNILAFGEITGHCHAVSMQGTEVLTDDKGNLFLSVTSPKGTQVTHDEHSTIDLPCGEYRIDIQREYSPEEIRRVQD